MRIKKQLQKNLERRAVMESSLMKKKSRPLDNLLYVLIYISAGISVLLLIGIIVYVFYRGIGVVDLSFLTTVTSVFKGTVGILGNIINTFYIVVLTL